jgi:hypothetical protein
MRNKTMQPQEQAKKLIMFMSGYGLILNAVKISVDYIAIALLLPLFFVLPHLFTLRIQDEEDYKRAIDAYKVRQYQLYHFL